MITDISPFSGWTRFRGTSVDIKRDDFFPISGGGNKGRKLKRIFEHSLPKECDVVITNGGTQSNHARVCAIMAAERGIEAHLVLHGAQEELENPIGNLMLATLCGATIHIREPYQIGPTIKNLRQDFFEAGRIPFIIPGGGHCLDGTLAYADAVDEIDELPDVIVLPSGTGTTQAGIMAGLDRRKADTNVIGVSVARKNTRGRDVVHESYCEARTYLKLENTPEREVLFDDRWTYGGYGKTDHSLLKTICDVACQTGLILDPIYTGKAFAAMLDMIETGEIEIKKTVLFWHTGGLINTLASPELQEFVVTQ